jgi:hypothetical protein
MGVVYRHRKLGTQEVFYIGIGNIKYRPYSEYGRNKFWHNIVNKYGYEVDIIFDDISWKEAKEAEILLIKLYGRRDLGTGCLVNMTDGGDGAVGHIKSEYQIQKIIESNKNRVYTEEMKIKATEHLKTEDIAKKRALSKSKIILNIETGIFYLGIKEAADSINMNVNTLRGQLNGTNSNRSNLVYV